MNDENLGSTRIVVRDTIILFLLLSEARRRIVMRVYGSLQGDSNSLTVFAVGSMAGGLHARAARVLRVPRRPSLAATAVGAGALKETAHGTRGRLVSDDALLRRTGRAGGVRQVIWSDAAEFVPRVRRSFRSVQQGRAGSWRF